MKIQQIGNAMVRIRYAGKTFLTDPWLAPRGSMGTFRDYPMFRCRPERLDLPLPLCDLPMPVADILAGVDAHIVTHVHPDHIDMADDGSVGAPLDKRAVPVFVQSEEDAAVLRRSGFARVEVLGEETVFAGIRLSKTPGRHGTIIPCGPSCGVVFRHPDGKAASLPSRFFSLSSALFAAQAAFVAMTAGGLPGRERRPVTRLSRQRA